LTAEVFEERSPAGTTAGLRDSRDDGRIAGPVRATIL